MSFETPHLLCLAPPQMKNQIPLGRDLGGVEPASKIPRKGNCPACVGNVSYTIVLSHIPPHGGCYETRLKYYRPSSNVSRSHSIGPLVVHPISFFEHAGHNVAQRADVALPGLCRLLGNRCIRRFYRSVDLGDPEFGVGHLDSSTKPSPLWQ
jgi:hypothetical protein